MPYQLPPDQSGMGSVFGAPYQRGDMLRNMPPVQPTGVGETLANAFDGQKPWSVAGALAAMMSAIPGTSRPVGTIPKSVQPYRANNYSEPPVAANGIKPFEHERFRRHLENLLPINTPAKEAQARMLQAKMRQAEALPDNSWGPIRPPTKENWGQPPAPQSRPNPLTTDLDQIYGAISPQERARLLGIKVVE